MSLKNKISELSRATLHVRIFPSDTSWDEIRQLARVYGENKVREVFDQWAKNAPEPPKYPLSAFLRVADGLIANPPAPDSPDLVKVIYAMASISDGNVVWTTAQRRQINLLLSKFSATQVIDAFAKLWENTKENKSQWPWAAKTFIEVAPQLIFVNEKRTQAQAAALRFVRKADKPATYSAGEYVGTPGAGGVLVRKTNNTENGGN